MDKKILVAPLNWGLGHATRCIPIITALLQNNFTPVIATDGAALSLLTKEFPDLEALELPSYHITYTKKGYLLKLKLLQNTPRLLKSVREEQHRTQTIVKTHAIEGIISDNRFGVYHRDLPSVYITHQLKVLSGNTTWLSTKLHDSLINRFDECWVPDLAGLSNLSGKMGYRVHPKIPVKYIGPLSRFKKTTCESIYDIMVLLSGPEPQREILEEKLLEELKNHQKDVLFVKGVVEPEQKVHRSGNLTVYNFMTTEILERSLNTSRLIIARPGYTTLMDLAKLEKQAFFIPTPGQFEQVYLAQRMADQNLAPFCKQEDFSLEKLNTIENFKGLKAFNEPHGFTELFNLFKSK